MSGWDVNPEVADEAQKWADVDDRLGDHDVIITEVTAGAWDDGRARINLRGELLTCNHFKFSATISQPSDAGDLAAAKSEGKKMHARAMAMNNNIISQLKEHYEVVPDQIKEGDKFRIKTGKQMDKKDEERKKYFIRLIAFLPKEAIGKDGGGATDDTPF